LRGTPGSACPQPEPNATELPSCAPISARAAQRRRRRRWWRGEEGERRRGPEGHVLRHVLWHALRSALCRVIYVLALHVSTATATGPAAPTKDSRSKSTWRGDEEATRMGLTGCAREKPCASWGFLSCSAQVRRGLSRAGPFLSGNFKKVTATYETQRHRETHTQRDTEIAGYRKLPPLCA